MEQSPIMELKQLNRKMLYDAWQKYKNNQPMNQEEETITGLMALHKEWYHYWEAKDFDREITPETDVINPYLHITFDTIILNQVEQNYPQQAKLTYDKLTRKGESHIEAIHEMAYILAREFYNSATQGKKFNLNRYAARLKELG